VAGEIVMIRELTRGKPFSRKKGEGPSTLAFFASVSPSAMAPPPNCFLCAITYEKQRKLLGIGAIADGITDAKNASVDGP
jgi:hypothetical protein